MIYFWFGEFLCPCSLVHGSATVYFWSDQVWPFSSSCQWQKNNRGECVKSRVHAVTAGLSVEYVGPWSGDKNLRAKSLLHVIFVKNWCIWQIGGPKGMLPSQSTGHKGAAFPHSQVQSLGRLSADSKDEHTADMAGHRFTQTKGGGSTYTGAHIDTNSPHRAWTTQTP